MLSQAGTEEEGGRKEWGNLAKRLKSKGQSVSGIYLELDTIDELADGQLYTVSLYFLMRDAEYRQEGLRNDALSILATAEEAFLKCPAIELESARIVTEEDLRVSDMRQLLPRDYADYLSQREGHVHAGDAD